MYSVIPRGEMANRRTMRGIYKSLPEIIHACTHLPKMRFIAAFAACALVHVTTAFETTGFQLKENINVPKGWTRIGAAPADHTVKLQIGLYQSNFDSLERQLLEVSDRMSSVLIVTSCTD